MKKVSKKSIAQLQYGSNATLGKNQMNLIKGGGDGDGTDGSSWLGVVDIIDG